MKLLKNQKGYVALTSVLVIMAVAVIIGVTVSMNAINEMQMGFSDLQSEQAFITADACTEESILRLKRDETPPTTMTIDSVSGECNIVVYDDAGDTCNDGDSCYLQVRGTVDDYNSLIEVELTMGSSFTINSWHEVGDFTSFE